MWDGVDCREFDGHSKQTFGEKFSKNLNEYKTNFLRIAGLRDTLKKSSIAYGMKSRVFRVIVFPKDIQPVMPLKVIKAFT
jgi:hypothetical protein